MDRKSVTGGGRGLTLLELLIALAVLAVSLTTVAPAFSKLGHSIRLGREAGRLVEALNLARSEAILARETIALCPSDNGAPPRCGGDYRSGWLVYRPASDDPGQIPQAEDLIRRFDGLPPGYRVSNRAGTRVPDERLTFYPDGSSRRSLGFLFCPPAGTSAPPLAVVLNNVGRPRLAWNDGSCPEEVL